MTPYFDNEKGAFSIKYDLARSRFQSFSKMEANYDVGRGILGQNIGFRFFDIYYLTYNLKSNLQCIHLG